MKPHQIYHTEGSTSYANIDKCQKDQSMYKTSIVVSINNWASKSYEINKASDLPIEMHSLTDKQVWKQFVRDKYKNHHRKIAMHC